MAPEILSTFSTFSQIGISIVGFSGLVVAFREHSTRDPAVPQISWSQPERMMLWAMVANALAISCFSTLPTVLEQLFLKKPDMAQVLVYSLTAIYASGIATWWYCGAITKKSQWVTIKAKVYYYILFTNWIYAIFAAIFLALGALGIAVPRTWEMFSLIVWTAVIWACVQFLFFINRMIK